MMVNGDGLQKAISAGISPFLLETLTKKQEPINDDYQEYTPNIVAVKPNVKLEVAINPSRRISLEPKEFDQKNYHCLPIEHPYRELLNMTASLNRHQVDSFVFQDRQFIALAWLGSVRIFEHLKNSSKPVFRLFKTYPENFISLSLDLVTSVHFCEPYLYIGRMRHSGAVVELLNIMDCIIDKTLLYENCLVNSIHSDSTYIFVQTDNSRIHLHQKSIPCAILCVDFTDLITGPLVQSHLLSVKFDSRTRPTLITCSTNELLVSEYSSTNHQVNQCYRFDDDYLLVSICKVEKLFILHRNHKDFSSCDKIKSRLEFGYMETIKTQDPYTQRIEIEDVFTIYAQLSFEYVIKQVRHHQGKLYLLARKCNDETDQHYEVGSLTLGNLHQDWLSYRELVKEPSNLIVQDQDVAVICDENTSDLMRPTYRIANKCTSCDLMLANRADLRTHRKTGHPSMFRAMKKYENKSLMDKENTA